MAKAKEPTPMVDLVGAVVKGLEDLGVQKTH